MGARFATHEDFVRFYGREPGEDWIDWIGMVADDGRVFGILVWHENGVVVGALDRRDQDDPVSAFVLHKSARAMLRAAFKAGEEQVSVFCGPHPKAEFWLRRLGFEPGHEHDGQVVWVCQGSKQ